MALPVIYILLVLDFDHIHVCDNVLCIIKQHHLNLNAAHPQVFRHLQYQLIVETVDVRRQRFVANRSVLGGLVFPVELGDFLVLRLRYIFD